MFNDEHLAKNHSIPFFGAIPSFSGYLKDGQSVIINDENFTLNFTTHLSGNTVVVDYTTSPNKLLARAKYLFLFTEKINLHDFIFPGSYSLTFKDLSDSDIAYFKLAGIRLYRLPYKVSDMVYDVKRLITLFSPSIFHKYSEESNEENIQFLKESANITLIPRQQSNFPLSASDVHSGDVFGSFSLNGLGPLIMATTGSKISHLQIALEIDGKMNVCESTGGAIAGKTGIVCTLWDDFVKDTVANEGLNIVHMRLASPYREKFDAKRAYDTFVKQLLGSPYGFETFVFSALDTVTDNLFYPLDEGSLEILYYLIDLIKASLADLVIGQGIANRLNMPVYPTNSRASIYKKMASIGKLFKEIYIMPELDSYRYGSDGHVSRVCSCLAMDILRASGAFEGTEFAVDWNAAEQTPKDIFAFKLWDITTPVPAACAANDPDLPYCQLRGTSKIVFDERTLNAHSACKHMSETCPTKAPYYERPEVC